MSTDDDRFRREEDLLRQALREEGDRVLPSPDALARIRRRTSRPPLWRRPVVLGMAAASVTAVAVIVGGAYVLGGPSDDTTATGGDSSPSAVATTPAAPPSSSPSSPATELPKSPAPSGTVPPPAGTASVPVYYVAETPRGLRLAREFQTRPVPDGVIAAAVTAMLAEPALDPDYQSYWQADTQLGGVEVTGDVIEVDLTGATDYTGVREEIAQISVQQLVYTVTAAASMAGENGALPVQILVDGEPAGQMWGQLDLSQPIARAPELDVRQAVQIDNPQDGAAVGRTVTVDGAAAAFEAQVNWQIFDAEGNLVDNGFAMTTESGKFTPFSFSVDLGPGFYSVVVTESDPSGGVEGPGPTSDTKNFEVK